MIKCSKHQVDYVWSPAKDYGLKKQNWVCPECEKEKVEFFNSIISAAGENSIEKAIAKAQGGCMSKLPHKYRGGSRWSVTEKIARKNHTVNGYKLAIALESTTVLNKLVESQHKKRTVDRWRKLSRYLHRAMDGKVKAKGAQS